MRMKFASKHSRQGARCEDDDDIPQEITPYEAQRNIRRKALQDEVEKALVDSGFGDVAKLRPLFTAQLAGGEGIGKTKRNVTGANRSIISEEGDGKLRRSARNVLKLNGTTELPSISSQSTKRVRNSTFCRLSCECMNALRFSCMVLSKVLVLLATQKRWLD